MLSDQEDVDIIEEIDSYTGGSSGGFAHDAPRMRGRWLFLLILIAVPTITTGLAGTATFLYRLYESLPIHSLPQNIEPSLVSKVYNAAGDVIHEFSIERRVWVPLDQIPENLQNAVIAIEDRKFYRHWGVDVQRNFSALLINYSRGRRAQGASTVTQQLARNVYLTADKSIIRKLREILTAIHLERHFTKREILELYLNQAYLGAGVFGVQSAAERYFSKSIEELTLGEAAVIAAVIQTPERLRPDRADNITRITARRNTVLRAMAQMGFITASEELAAVAEPVAANPHVSRPTQAPYFVEMVRRYVANKYGNDLLYNGGLQIHTTLDSYAQDTAEAAVARQVRSLQARLNRMFLDATRAERDLGITREAFLRDFDSIFALGADRYARLHDTLKHRRAQMAVVALDVRTGAVRTLVGGRDFNESRFNRATQARRQAGSAFKPYVYAAALGHGIYPATVVLDQPITLITADGEWRPQNYDRTFRGPMSVRDALARSNNLIAIQVFNRVGGANVVNYTRNLAVRSPMHTGPSLAIGAVEVAPMEITSSFGIFPNEGMHVEPYFVERVIDKNGRVLEEAVINPRRAISPQEAFLVNSMMGSVVCCGTGAAIPAQLRRPAAGKTGTTDEYSDAWFVGYTPQIVATVWAGIDERLSMGHGVTGGMAAIPVWVAAMRALHRDLPVRDFARPPTGLRSISVCTATGEVAGPSCPRSRADFFPTDANVEMCTLHGGGGASYRGAGSDVFGPSRRNGTDSREREQRKRSLMF